jgi:hypothetical protein
MLLTNIMNGLKNYVLFILILMIAQLALGLDSTDSIMDGDLAQSGYLPGHNMDPGE